VIAPDETDFEEPPPYWLERIDFTDGRTRIHLLVDVEPGDIHEIAAVRRHRIVDRVLREAVLNLWPLDCVADHQFRDGVLTLWIEPTKLTLHIDLARRSFRPEGAGWRPIEELQRFAEDAIGPGFGIREKKRPEEERTRPAREEALRPAEVRERRQALLGAIMIVALIIATAAIFYMLATRG
jgi:hypothetical protein